MALTLAVYPHWLTVGELRREIEDAKRLKEASEALVAVGLLETHGTSIRPTRAAAHLERLRLP